MTTRAYWCDARREPGSPGGYAALDRDLRVDAVVVGGGITGLTTAVFLADAGLRVALLERGRLGGGTSGGTTGHLTAFLDVDLGTLAGRIGEGAARQVISATLGAIEEIEKLAREAPQACAFERVPGVRFTDDASREESLERECEVARRLGLDARMARAPALHPPFAAALRIERQAQLSPLPYLDGLAASLVARGGRIFERTAVRTVEDGGVIAENGRRIEARFVVLATHTPIGVVATLQTRLRAMTSYVLAAELATPLEPGLYWDDARPYHYVRTADQGRIAIIGGEDHATGRDADSCQHMRALERWARMRLPLRDVVARWSAELFEPADGLPYIGFAPGSSTRLVAAGFSGTGLTFGTLAARILTGLALGTPLPGSEVFAPSRIGSLAAFASSAREGAKMLWHLVSGGARARVGADLAELAHGSGRVLSLDGKLVAAHRDALGELHLLSPRCTHLGCVVAWNALEQTWDCPCHGGRFRATGEVLAGPPLRPLDPVAKEDGE